MIGGRSLLPLLCSAGLHSAFAVWLVAASGAGALRPLLIDLIPEPQEAPVPESLAEPPRRPPPPVRRQALARPVPAEPRAPRAAATVPRSAPSPPAAAPPSPPAPPEPRPTPTPPVPTAPPAVEAPPVADTRDPAPSAASAPPPPQAPPQASPDGAAHGPATGPGNDAARAGTGPAPAGPATALARPGTADGRGAVPAEYGPYLRRFREAVQSELRYPLSARRRGLAGSVELEVAIAPDGRVTAVKVVSSSSHEMLDEAAADAVRRLRPIPLPPNLPPRPLVVRLPLVFDLR